MDGSKLVLHLAGARIEVLKPSLRDSLLGWLVNPNIALLFLVGGALLIYLEFNTPGTIVPGALGTLMVLLAIFALDLLPIRYTAVMLLVAALVLLLAGGQVWRPRRVGHRGHRLPDLWHPDAGGRAGAGDGRQPLGGLRRQRRIRGDYGLSGAAGRARPAHEGAHWRRRPWSASVLRPWSRWRPRATCWWREKSGARWPAEPVAKGAPLRVVGHEQMLLHVAPAEPPQVPEDRA